MKNAGNIPATLCRRKQNSGSGDKRSQGTLYTGHNVTPACCLRYDWTGWPTKGTELPPQIAAVACATAPLWEQDGLRLLTPYATTEKVQLLFSATPQVNPVFFCQRVKGRLQHALRKAGERISCRKRILEILLFMPDRFAMLALNSSQDFARRN